MKKVGLGWRGTSQNNNKVIQMSSIVLREQQKADIRKVSALLPECPWKFASFPTLPKMGGFPPRAVKISDFP